MTTSLGRFRKWFAFGSGVGVEIGQDDLDVVVVRVRPSGVRVAGAMTISRFRQRPAAEWGAEYAAFLKSLGASHLSATVLLPRRDLIVRHLTLTGVADRDLDAAISFQLDSLHPYGEDDAAHSWCRIGPGGSALIAILRRETLDRTSELFAEAGIKVASFTFAAAAVRSGVRLLSAPPEGFLGWTEREDGLEIYGESPAKPLFSAAFDLPLERASALAAAELRLPEGTEPQELTGLLPKPGAAPQDFDFSRSTLAYAAALAGACPRLALPLNLLPVERRVSSSRAIFVPTAALGLLLVAGLVALASIAPVEDRKYLAALEAEIARLEPQARKSAEFERTIEQIRSRTRLLDSFRARSKDDMDVLAEVTGLIAPPGWLSSIDMNRNSLMLAGEAEQAAPLLKALDGSPLFQNSEFMVPIGKSGALEAFRIRAGREGAAR
jgi:Tfp pilus assembly protein PilN